MIKQDKDEKNRKNEVLHFENEQLATLHDKIIKITKDMNRKDKDIQQLKLINDRLKDTEKALILQLEGLKEK